MLMETPAHSTKTQSPPAQFQRPLSILILQVSGAPVLCSQCHGQVGRPGQAQRPPLPKIIIDVGWPPFQALTNLLLLRRWSSRSWAPRCQAGWTARWRWRPWDLPSRMLSWRGKRAGWEFALTVEISRMLSVKDTFDPLSSEGNKFIWWPKWKHLLKKDATKSNLWLLWRGRILYDTSKKFLCSCVVDSGGGEPTEGQEAIQRGPQGFQDHWSVLNSHLSR